jgi:hypothetical protein
VQGRRKRNYGIAPTPTKEETEGRARRRRTVQRKGKDWNSRGDDMAAVQGQGQGQGKLLYIVVVDDDGATFRYTRSLLHSTLQLMGCKPRHAFEVR